MSDYEKGKHPKLVQGERTIFSQNRPDGSGSSIRYSAYGESPVWCSLDEDLAMLSTGLNRRLHKTDLNQNATRHICYSGEVPEDFGHTKPYIHQYEEDKGQCFIEQKFYPYKAFSSISLLVSMDAECVMPEYFNLYRMFCVDERLQCCIAPVARGKFVLNLIIKHGDDTLLLMDTMKKLVSYLSSSRLEYYEKATVYNLFKTTFDDNCSFQRWYYDSIYSGIISPERFMEASTWENDFCMREGLKVFKAAVNISSRRRSRESFIKDIKKVLCGLIQDNAI